MRLVPLVMFCSFFGGCVGLGVLTASTSVASPLSPVDPLLVAAANGRIAEVRALLPQADLSARDQHGWTALHHATAGNFVNTVALLLDRGADANAKNLAGVAPLHFACQEGYLAVVRHLLDAGASPGLEASPGVTPLNLALAAERDEVAELLLGVLEAKGGAR